MKTETVPFRLKLLNNWEGLLAKWAAESNPIPDAPPGTEEYSRWSEAAINYLLDIEAISVEEILPQ